MVMAERQETHRHDLENRVVEAGVRSTRLGQWLAFVVALSGMGLAGYLAYLGQPWQAIAVFTGDLVGMVAVFHIGRARGQEEREKRRRELAEGLPEPP